MTDAPKKDSYIRHAEFFYQLWLSLKRTMATSKRATKAGDFHRRLLHEFCCETCVSLCSLTQRLKQNAGNFFYVNLE